MTGWYISRIRLARSASVRALAPLILPPEEDRRTGAAHHWLWTLFADGSERKRDFIWREETARGERWRTRFIALSARPPQDRHNLFDVETKPFEPVLVAGDRLRFKLTANPAVSQARARSRGKRIDPVAAALKLLDADERAERRFEITHTAGEAWLATQGRRSGFVLDAGLSVAGDDWRVIPRTGGKPITYSVLNFEGRLTVTDPAAFLVRLTSGFGKAKAFGCGLMLIRRG